MEHIKNGKSSPRKVMEHIKNGKSSPEKSWNILKMEKVPHKSHGTY
jgi:hypothetical protein